MDAGTNNTGYIEVLRKDYWHHAAAIGGLASGLSSQVTTCKYQGVVFYVRENVTGTPSFLISSGERWGDKVGNKPRPERQVLELLAPPACWEVLARLVREVDTLKRPVRRNKQFTKHFITQLYAKGI